MTEPTPPTTTPDPAEAVDPAGPVPSVAPTRRRAYAAAVPLIALVVLGLDQLTKYLAVEELTGRGRVDVVGDLFGFYLIRNPGAAFSMATGATWIFSVVAIAVAVFIIRISRTLGHWGWAVALGLLLGGAVGNLTDRVFRSPGVFRGHVVDFLELPNWPIFNLADCSITCAAVLIAVLSVMGIGTDGQKVSDGKNDKNDGTNDPEDKKPDA
ncbi:signal peptidase II [Kineosporia succinea]|uniref:Lipoprotein signal peptidase n=1 Tax=Kineosporia succinea TaxID=84632 RepID=A0ABT9P6J5_9ACTN|nr:signal peptidase II [Kineosporia succinea]MDP9828309.1 signal peptidase II [Kineosporia succinea]